MKTLNAAARIAIAFGLISVGLGLAAPTASAGLFNRRTVIIQSPVVYASPVQTVYAAPVPTVVSAPVSTVYTSPVPTVYADPLLTPAAYVPTVSSRVVSAPVTTTYVPTVTTVPSVLVPTTRVRVISPRRAYLLGY
jgi:hypothetical protein